MVAVLSMLECGGGKYWALKLSHARRAGMRRLLDPCSIRRPQRLPSSYPASGVMTACVGANPSPQPANKLTDSAPRDQVHWSGTYLCRTHLESGISQQPVARRRQLGDGHLRGLFSGFLAYDDLELINALEIEEACLEFQRITSVRGRSNGLGWVRAPLPRIAPLRTYRHDDRSRCGGLATGKG
jgi:hypothetical protein